MIFSLFTNDIICAVFISSYKKQILLISKKNSLPIAKENCFYRNSDSYFNFAQEKY